MKVKTMHFGQAVKINGREVNSINVLAGDSVGMTIDFAENFFRIVTGSSNPSHDKVVYVSDTNVKYWTLTDEEEAKISGNVVTLKKK